jgi:hypothetical protein
MFRAKNKFEFKIWFDNQLPPTNINFLLKKRRWYIKGSTKTRIRVIKLRHNRYWKQKRRALF